jgi:AmmeMemoRadiSam system protein A
MATLTKEHRRTLVEVAVRAIATAAATPDRPWSEIDTGQYPVELRRDGASFVTLYRHRTLRGCRGSILAAEPLITNVSRSARAAAFFDERFDPVESTEVRELDVHISVLGPPARLHVDSEAELLRALRVGVDGLILREGSQQALFLPSVWKKLADPQTFVEHLKVKAGLSRSFWSRAVVCERFIVEEFEGSAAAYIGEN